MLKSSMSYSELAVLSAPCAQVSYHPVEVENEQVLISKSSPSLEQKSSRAKVLLFGPRRQLLFSITLLVELNLPSCNLHLIELSFSWTRFFLIKLS